MSAFEAWLEQTNDSFKKSFCLLILHGIDSGELTPPYSREEFVKKAEDWTGWDNKASRLKTRWLLHGDPSPDKEGLYFCANCDMSFAVPHFGQCLGGKFLTHGALSARKRNSRWREHYLQYENSYRRAEDKFADYARLKMSTPYFFCDHPGNLFKGIPYAVVSFGADHLDQGELLFAQNPRQELTAKQRAEQAARELWVFGFAADIRPLATIDGFAIGLSAPKTPTLALWQSYWGLGGEETTASLAFSDYLKAHDVKLPDRDFMDLVTPHWIALAEQDPVVQEAIQMFGSK